MNAVYEQISAQLNDPYLTFCMNNEIKGVHSNLNLVSWGQSFRLGLPSKSRQMCEILNATYLFFHYSTLYLHLIIMLDFTEYFI